MNSRRLSISLVWGLALVVGLGLSVELVHAFSHASWVETLVAALSLSYEQNLPTWYATCLLFSAGVVLAAIALEVKAQGGAHRRHWIGLSLAFLYLSLDESMEIHEHLGGLFQTGGVLYYDWVIPGAAIVIAFGAAYVPFLVAQHPSLRRRFIVAGALYVFGALVMELPLGYWVERRGEDGVGYALIDLVEETLELIGASLFLRACVDHLLELRAMGGPREHQR